VGRRESRELHATALHSTTTPHRTTMDRLIQNTPVRRRTDLRLEASPPATNEGSVNLRHDAPDGEPVETRCVTHSIGQDEEKAPRPQSLQSLIFTLSGRRDLTRDPLNAIQGVAM